MRVLVIDDEPFVRGILVRQLRILGYTEVIAYEHAHSALEFLGREPQSVGLVVLDLQMPEMDGVQCIRQLVHQGYSGALVLVSGEDQRVIEAAERLARAHKLTVLGALHKPVSTQALRDLMSKSRPLAAANNLPPNAYGPDDLRSALTNGELINHYQPIVALASNDVVGAEALVRWKHPRHGLVFPDQFIPLAEAHNLIDNLATQVIADAVRQARRWHDMGLKLRISVNVSMQNLHSLAFPEAVMHELDASELAGSDLMLEVTESRLTNDLVVPLDTLTRLRLKRVGLSIDDFGTGHSSLAQLRDLPFEELKVDRGFAHGACSNASLRAITEASVRMAQQLKLTTVAEGVEDKADWDFLRAAGCDCAQGYFIARPMEAGTFTAWLVEWQQRRLELAA